MTVLKNILPNGNVELIFLTEEDIPISIYEIDIESLIDENVA